MSRPVPLVHRLGIPATRLCATLLTLASLSSTTSATAATSPTATTVAARCEWPLVGPQPVTFTVTTDLGGEVVRPAQSPAFSYQLSMEAQGESGLLLPVIDAEQLRSISVKNRLEAATPSGVLPLTFTTQLATAADVRSTPPQDPFTMSGPSIALPRMSTSRAGDLSMTLVGLDLNLQAFTRDINTQRLMPIAGLGSAADSDGDDLTFDLACTFPRSSTLGTVRFTDAAAPATPLAEPAPSPEPLATPPAEPTSAPRAADSPTPTPTPAPQPTPTPASPPVVVVDGRIMRFRDFRVALSFAAACPRRATVTLRARHRRPVRRSVRVHSSPTGCVVNADVNVRNWLPRSRAVAITVTGRGLERTTRRLRLG